MDMEGEIVATGSLLMTGSDERLARVIALINGKGGAGKTSTVANLAVELAVGGLRVLAFDCDLSGNLALDLGYVRDAGNDKGKSIVQAVWGTGQLHIIKDVRPNLDVVPGGKALSMIAKLANDKSLSEDMPGGSVGTAFALAVSEIADDYDVILIDCAPGNPELQEMVLTATRYVLIPTKTDAGGWDGLRAVGPQVKQVRAINPLITYLGVLLFGHSPAATRVMRSTRARLDEVGETAPLLDKPAKDEDGNVIPDQRVPLYIRHSEAAAHDCRARGQVAREVGRDAKALAKERHDAVLAAWKNKEEGSNVIALPPTAMLAGSAKDVASDYYDLAEEVLKRIARFEAEAAENGALAEAQGE